MVSIEEKYRIKLGCRVSVQPGITATKVNWSISEISGDDRRRPERGRSVEEFTCSRCRRSFCATVENSTAAKQKRWIYLILGVLLLLTLVVTVPMVIDLGGRPVEEDDPNATDGFGLVLLAAVFGFIAGLTFFRVEWAYTGIKKFRLVRHDGARSVWVKGHRIF
ncbi:hypothetical protein ACIRBX_01475 [Kitasatospora sp. NPDC096147]|uniref:hypothetical protein n=1 Tax=Kitasatospora sp. NPDC096147 TaxID=3364093 RepID=UPI00380FFA55